MYKYNRVKHIYKKEGKQGIIQQGKSCHPNQLIRLLCLIGFFTLIYSRVFLQKEKKHSAPCHPGRGQNCTRNYFLHLLAKIPYAEISMDCYF